MKKNLFSPSMIISYIYAFLFGAMISQCLFKTNEIEELKKENFSLHAQVQEYKQTLHLIEMRNEGIEYIDEMNE